MRRRLQASIQLAAEINQALDGEIKVTQMGIKLTGVCAHYVLVSLFFHAALGTARFSIYHSESSRLWEVQGIDSTGLSETAPVCDRPRVVDLFPTNGHFNFCRTRQID